MESLAQKFLSFSEVKRVAFTQEEIGQFHTMAELYGKLDLLDTMQYQNKSNIEDQAKKIRKDLIAACKEAGLFAPEVLEEISSFLFGIIPLDEEKIQQNQEL